MFSPVLKKGSAELLILSLLEDEPLHGYEIAKRIERRSGGLLEFRVSSLYPILCRLDERGWARGRWVEKQGERRRRYYSLTKKGVAALASERRTWRQYQRAVNLVVEPSHA
ncbi:MAG: PadR family transcriptional regulator [Deltaproteobacteria bacterium]|nr:PadR family transcriptional regulator [Deltaproteobacteria bacterium]